MSMKNNKYRRTVVNTSAVSSPYSRSKLFRRGFSTSNAVMSNVDWETEKDKYLCMTPEEKREQYRNKNFVELSSIPTWQEDTSKNEVLQTDSAVSDGKYQFKKELNEKVSIFTGDITTLEIDTIVNAANNTLLGGGGVDGAIHRAAGRLLVEECKTLDGCPTGQAKITGGYMLPAKYVIHTVGPIGEKSEFLRNCYNNSLNLMKENKLETIAFPCISTGIYGYPNESAATVALETTRNFLESGSNAQQVRRIIFCLFLDKDIDIYKRLLPKYFPNQ